MDGVGDDVTDQPQRVLGREDVGAAGQVLLDDVVLGRPREVARSRALLLGRDHVEAQQPHGGGVDGHRGVHVRERDAVEEPAHLAQVRDGHPDLADLAASQRGVGVVAGLGGQVEGDRQAGLPLGQVGAVELVGGRGRRVAGVGPHHPGTILDPVVTVLLVHKAEGRSAATSR